MSTHPASSPALADMFKDLKALLETGDFSDFVVTCGSSSLNVHRFIISRQSEFLKKACSGNFREASERKIDFPDDDEGSVGALIKYLYTLDYESNATPLTLHINTYILADNMGVKHLVTLTEEKFKSSIQATVDINDLLAATHLAYDTGDLTSAFRTMITTHALDGMSSGADFQKLLVADPQLPIDIALALKERQDGTEEPPSSGGPGHYNCPGCRATYYLPEGGNLPEGHKCLSCGKWSNNWHWSKYQ